MTSALPPTTSVADRSGFEGPRGLWEAMVASLADGAARSIVRVPPDSPPPGLAQVIDLGDGDAHLAYLARVGLRSVGGVSHACVTEARIEDGQVISLDAFRSRHPRH